MMYGQRVRMLTSMVLVIGLAVGRALAVAPEIKDGGKFFSEDAVRKADKQIREIARKYELDLLIETVATIPGEQAERVKALPRADRAKFFRNWASDRAEAAVVQGLYILVCREPPFLEIIVTARGRAVFDNKATEELRDRLVQAFRDKHYDEGLQRAVEFVRERLAAAASKEAK